MTKIETKRLALGRCRVLMTLEDGVTAKMNFEGDFSNLSPHQIRELYAFMTDNRASLARETVSAGIALARQLYKNAAYENADSVLVTGGSNKQLAEFLSGFSNVNKSEVARFLAENLFADIIDGNVSIPVMNEITVGLLGEYANWSMNSSGRATIFDNSAKYSVDVEKEVRKEPIRAWFLALLEAYIVKNGGEL